MISSNQLNIVIFGLSITSSWGNGHATTFRGLIKELNYRGHKITFFEKNLPYYESNRDLPHPEYCKVVLYKDFIELQQYKKIVADANLVIVGSYVPDGVRVGYFVVENAKGIKAFYDIDTPVTLTKLRNNDFEYLEPPLISQYDLYLSFTSGPTLKFIENHYHSPLAVPLYCSFDPELYFNISMSKKWILGYMGTYSNDRQAALNEFLITPAKKMKTEKFIVAGPQYPENISWPENIERIYHIPPNEHAAFYNSQLFTLNITRSDMLKAGYSPSVRLFEAAACGTPIISDNWPGIETILIPNEEIFIVNNSEDVLNLLNNVTEEERLRVGKNARKKIMIEHTAEKRAIQLEEYYQQAIDNIKDGKLIKSNN